MRRLAAPLALAILASCGADQVTNNETRSSPRGSNREVSVVANAPQLYTQFSAINANVSSPIPVGTTIVAEDFDVPSGQEWTVKALILSGKLGKSSIPFSIRADNGGNPGTVLFQSTQAPADSDKASCCFDVTDYRFDLATPLVLTAGTYWIVTESSTPGPSSTFDWQVTFFREGALPKFSSSLDPTSWATIGDDVPALALSVTGTLRGSQTIIFQPLPPTTALPGTSTDLHAFATSGLTVSLSAGPSNVCTLSGTTLSFIGAGKCTITANQAGDANTLPAPQVMYDVDVAGGSQTITFTSTPPSPAFVHGTYAVSATGGASGNPVVFSVGPASVCTLSGSVVQFVDVGSCTIAANQSGGAGFEPAQQVTQTVNVGYRFDGFGDPVKNGVLNVMKTGRTIPLAWRLTDAVGAPITNLTKVVVTVTDLGCGIGTTANLAVESAAGNSGLQNLGNGYYQFNWKVPASYAKSCKTLYLDLREASGPRTAQFEFTK